MTRTRTAQPDASAHTALPLGNQIAWKFLFQCTYFHLTALHGFRAWGQAHVPRTGPVLFACNHQSYLDPLILGVAVPHRPFNSMARSTLFRHPLFGAAIRMLNAFPVERGSADMAAMRKAIDILNAGQAMLIYPEGTRTIDGTTGPFHPGLMLLIKRARPAVVPVAIEGAYKVWPRDRRIPRCRGRIGVMIAPPIRPQTLIAMGAEPAMDHLRHTVETMRLDVAARLERAGNPIRLPAAAQDW